MMLCPRYASQRHASCDSQRELAEHDKLHSGPSALCRREYMHLCATMRGIMLKLIFGSKTEHEIETAFGHHLNIILTSFGNRFWNLLGISWESLARACRAC